MSTSSISHCSSGSRRRATVKPRPSRRAATCAPDVSSRTPALAPSEAVMTRAVRSTPPATLLAACLGLGCPDPARDARSWARLRPRVWITRGRPDPGSTLAAGLRDQVDGLDLNATLDALDHVVEGQRRDRRRRHGFHLDTGLACRRGLRTDAQDARTPIRCDGNDE